LSAARKSFVSVPPIVDVNRQQSIAIIIHLRKEL